jgi:type VI secretion system protein ImpG
MSDKLLDYYNSELNFLRRLGDEFAGAHADVAPYLAMGGQGDLDPYVGRLIQSVAYMNARLRRKIDDDFPEVAGSMMDILYPHYQRPFPSSTIVRLALDRGQTEQYDGYTIERGATLEFPPVEGDACRFQTRYPVVCWPFDIHSVDLRGIPFQAPVAKLGRQPLGCLQVGLKAYSNEVKLADFKTTSLRFYIQLPVPFNFQFYELMFNHVLGVAVASSHDADDATILPASCVKAVGFEREDGMLDYPPQSFLGYRLVTELFAFPQKFLFFDVEIGDAFQKLGGDQFQLYFYLNRRLEALEPNISETSLQFGCTPAINLYKQKSAAFRMTHFDVEHEVIPDSRRPRSHEVYTVDRVIGNSTSKGEIEFLPFYSFRHGVSKDHRTFWHASRRERFGSADADRGSALDIAFVDLDFDPAEPGDWMIDIETTCCNGNLPFYLPVDPGRTELDLEGYGAIEQAVCLVKPTRTLRAPLGQGLRWRLVSHLSLNQLSIVGGEDSVEAFRELLRLYEFSDSPENQDRILGVESVSSKRMPGRIPGDTSGGVCRGLEVQVMFDEEKFKDGRLFLFASVLEQFVALYTNINSFTQFVAISKKTGEEIKRWGPRAGDRFTL